jgi:hypothetical protein
MICAFIAFAFAGADAGYSSDSVTPQVQCRIDGVIKSLSLPDCNGLVHDWYLTHKVLPPSDATGHPNYDAVMCSGPDWTFQTSHPECDQLIKAWQASHSASASVNLDFDAEASRANDLQELYGLAANAALGASRTFCTKNANAACSYYTSQAMRCSEFILDMNAIFYDLDMFRKGGLTVDQSANQTYQSLSNARMHMSAADLAIVIPAASQRPKAERLSLSWVIFKTCLNAVSR